VGRELYVKSHSSNINGGQRIIVRQKQLSVLSSIIMMFGRSATASEYLMLTHNDTSQM